MEVEVGTFPGPWSARASGVLSPRCGGPSSRHSGWSRVGTQDELINETVKNTLGDSRNTAILRALLDPRLVLILAGLLHDLGLSLDLSFLAC